jgi:glycosyltransferase involved in cell wall biosynthesis
MNNSYALLMTVKNAEKYLAETLDSVFAQTLLPKEIWIVDDLSTDRTLEVIESYGPSVNVIKNTNVGMAEAYNLAIPLVTTEFLAFLDGDDLWLPEKAERQINFLNANPEYDAVCCSVLNFKKSDPKDIAFEASREFGPSRLFTATTFRKEVFSKFGLPDASAGHFGLLYEWWSRASDAGIKCGTMEEVLFHRRVHDSNSWVRERELGNKTLIEIARRNINRRKNG